VFQVAVRQDTFVNASLRDDRVEILLGIDGDACRIGLAAERRRIPSFFDVRNLGGGETDNPNPWIVSEAGVEVVKIPPGCSQNEHPPLVHA
jgi:hypothetical protein